MCNGAGDYEAGCRLPGGARAAHDGREAARGASSREAFRSPEPLSHTRALVSSSSHILAQPAGSAGGAEQGGPSSVPAELAWSAPRRRGQSRVRAGVGAGDACHLPFPWGRKVKKLRSMGKRTRTGFPGQQAHHSAPGQEGDHPIEGPPQPFTLSPFHKLGTHYGYPPPSLLQPQGRGKAQATGTPSGAQGSPSASPSPVKTETQDKEVGTSGRVWS